MNPAQHKSQAMKFQKRVWLTGTPGATLLRGTGVCYNRVYGTAADWSGERDKRVAVPSATNNRDFAGVLDDDYVVPTTGEILVTINEPGSVCDVAVGANTTINSGMLTCFAGNAGAGRFILRGLPGRGSIIPLQTKAAAIVNATLDGSGSLATNGTALTKTAAFANAEVGDKVIFLGSRDQGTDKVIDLSKAHTIATVTSDDAVALSASAVKATPDAALTNSFIVIRNNPTVIAEICTGAESGLTEMVTPPDTGGVAVMSYMVGGVTYIGGGVTIGTADANGALAEGDQFGLRKGFWGLGDLTTNDAKVTLASAGKQQAVADEIETAGDGTPLALASFELDAAGEFIFLEWLGQWQELTSKGVDIADS